MKTLMIGFDSVDLERMPHLSWLIGIGCYGKLDGTAAVEAAQRDIAQELARAGKRILTLDGTNRDNLRIARESSRSDTDDCIQIVRVAGDSSDDAELGTLFESLDADAAILILWADGNAVNFALASSQSRLRGELQTAHVVDLTPTLLELSGDTVPDWVHGKSLLTPVSAEGAGYTADEEEIIRERLGGLGYIG